VSSELSSSKYFVYFYDTALGIWNLTDANFQAKAVRFDRLGNMFYLTPDNCVLNGAK